MHLSNGEALSGYDPPDSAQANPIPVTTPYRNHVCQRSFYNTSSTAFVYDNIFDQKFLSTTQIESWYYIAFPIQVRWKQGDFDNIATLTTQSSTLATSVSTRTSSFFPSQTGSTQVSQPAGQNDTSSPSRTRSIIIALSVALSVAAVGFGALLVWLIWQKSQRSKKDASFQASLLRTNQALPLYSNIRTRSESDTQLRELAGHDGYELDAAPLMREGDPSLNRTAALRSYANNQRQPPLRSEEIRLSTISGQQKNAGKIVFSAQH